MPRDRETRIYGPQNNTDKACNYPRISQDNKHFHLLRPLSVQLCFRSDLQSGQMKSQ